MEAKTRIVYGSIVMVDGTTMFKKQEGGDRNLDINKWHAGK